MPARTGAEYIAGLRDRAAEVYIKGERVKDVTTHPALQNGVRTLAHLYDLQYDPALSADMTYVSPTSGDRVGLSFITPHTVQDLERAAHDDAPLGAGQLRHDGPHAGFHEP